MQSVICFIRSYEAVGGCEFAFSFLIRNRMSGKRIVTKIEELDKRRSKVYTQEGSFVLYKGELTQYKIHENEEIREEIYQTIIAEVLPKRAKKRCLNLLQVRPYTEAGLRDKLKAGGYQDMVIEEAIEYVKKFRYIDDYDFACQYIFYHKETETKKKIEEKLLMKGVDKDTLKRACEVSYPEEDDLLELQFRQAKKLLEKKKYDPESMEWKEKQKAYAFLIRKGILAEVARKVMSIVEW